MPIPQIPLHRSNNGTEGLFLSSVLRVEMIFITSGRWTRVHMNPSHSVGLEGGDQIDTILRMIEPQDVSCLDLSITTGRMAVWSCSP